MSEPNADYVSPKVTPLAERLATLLPWLPSNPASAQRVLDAIAAEGYMIIEVPQIDRSEADHD